MKRDLVKIGDEFEEIGTRTIDERKRLTLGDLIKDFRRVRAYRNERGQLLIQPVVEIPASELWLFENKEALEGVKRGLKDVAEGLASKLDLDEL
jgi:hypothetical protein